MGLEITAFIETDTTLNFSNPKCFGEFFITKHNDLFYSLAGIYNHDCYIKSKGIPHPVSWPVIEKYQLQVLSEEETKQDIDIPYIREKDARYKIKEGKSHYIKDFYGHPVTDYISNPNFFNAGWLRFHEIQQCLNYSKIDMNSIQSDFKMVLKIMKDLQELEKNLTTRLVFWFEG